MVQRKHFYSLHLLDERLRRLIMLNFILTNHWWDEYESGRKTHEYRIRNTYWDTRVRNALIQKFDEERGLDFFRRLTTPSSITEISVIRFPKDLTLPCLFGRAYTSKHGWASIPSICIRNGKNTDLKTDDWVYDFKINDFVCLPF